MWNILPHFTLNINTETQRDCQNLSGAKKSGTKSVRVLAACRSEDWLHIRAETLVLCWETPSLLDKEPTEFKWGLTGGMGTADWVALFYLIFFPFHKFFWGVSRMKAFQLSALIRSLSIMICLKSSIMVNCQTSGHISDPESLTWCYPATGWAISSIRRPLSSAAATMPVCVLKEASACHSWTRKPA